MKTNKLTAVEDELASPMARANEDCLAVTKLLHAASQHSSSSPPPLGMLLGKVVGLDPSGLPLVAFSVFHEPHCVLARSTCPIAQSEIGREVVLGFESDDASKPLVLGLLSSPSPEQPQPKPQSVEVHLDGKQLTLSAQNEIVLRCGKASITLTRAGKVLINGEYLLSRSNGVNRIKGGSVQIN